MRRPQCHVTASHQLKLAQRSFLFDQRHRSTARIALPMRRGSLLAASALELPFVQATVAIEQRSFANKKSLPRRKAGVLQKQYYWPPSEQLLRAA